MSSGVITSRASTSSPNPGAYASSVLTAISPTRSRSSAHVPSRRCRGAAWNTTLITCLPSGASDGSASDGIVASSTGSSLTCPYFTASIACSTASIDGPITIRPRSRSASPPANAGRPPEREVDRAVAPGWRMFSPRHTVVGPTATGSSSRIVRFGSAADTTSGASSSVPSASATPTARSPRVRIDDDLGPRADLDAEAGGRGLERVGERVGAAPSEHRRSRRAAVGAGRVVQEHLRRARGPRAHRRVQHAARGERPAHGLLLEHLLHQVRDRHRQRTDRLAAGPGAEVAERLAQLQPHDRVGQRGRRGVGRDRDLDVGEEARDRADLRVEARERVRVVRAPRSAAPRRSGRRRPRT